MKTMTFEEAKRKLAHVATGKYHALQYELTVHGRTIKGKKDFPDEAECSVYTESGGWYSADTWAGAFALLKASGDRRKKHKADPKEQPL